MNFLGNILWIVLGGFIVCIEYIIASLLLMITIIGIPFGVQTIKLAWFSLVPFGRKTIQKQKSGAGSLLMNVIWIIVGGVWIALTHIALAVLFAITIIGIPFAKQHVKLAGLSLAPFGQQIVKI